MKFLIADSETPDERARRRDSVGKSAGETYIATLQQLEPGAQCTRITPADADAHVYTSDEIAAFDAVFLIGSPLHVYDETPETLRQLAFMRAVFASRRPSFGSCAGLQIAVAAAGGTVRKMTERTEAGIARRITPTEAGHDHPLLAGRPAAWDAPSIHGDEVETLPEGATLLATSSAVRVQAVEIRHEGGLFWGVQYHPELALGEIAAALRRQSDGLIEEGLADTPDTVEAQAALFGALHRDPQNRALRWRLGVDTELADEDHRRTELRNFLALARASVAIGHRATKSDANPAVPLSVDEHDALAQVSAATPCALPSPGRDPG